MTRDDLRKWRDKNERLNADRELARGDVVWDGETCHGVVVRIERPENPSDEDHGTIWIWQDRRTGYGADNCEHYAYVGWQRHLRVEE